MLMLGRLLLLGAAVAEASVARDAQEPASRIPIGSVVQSMSLPERIKAYHATSSTDVKRQSSRRLQESWVLCQLAGGTLDEADGKCRRCPDGAVDDGRDRNCCVINLNDFSLLCNVCEQLNGPDGPDSCGKYTCETDIEQQTTTCLGCIVDSSEGGGTLCSVFTCPPEANGRCSCSSVTWNGQSCGQCSFGADQLMSFDCSGVVGSDGPSLTGPTASPTPLPTPRPTPHPTPLPGSPTFSPTTENMGLCATEGGTLFDDGNKCKSCVEGNEFYGTICPTCKNLLMEGSAEGMASPSIGCGDFSCIDDFTTGKRNCGGCVHPSICLSYDCPIAAAMDGDYGRCKCSEFISGGQFCRTCGFGGGDDTLAYDCSNVGGPNTLTSGSQIGASSVGALLGSFLAMLFAVVMT
jgi:hypothetical protein